MATGSQPARRRRVRRTVLVAGSVVAVVAVVALAVGLWAFQPWRLLTSKTVDESLPAVDAGAGSAASPSSPAAGSAPGSSPAQPQPAVLAMGEFVTQEHSTTGMAKVVELADGSRLLRLESFSTSDGPDLHVWLTDQAAGGDWKSYDDGRYVRLGKLKGTDGNQNYPIPPDADLTGLRSVVVWCDRFNVAFGSAALSL